MSKKSDIFEKESVAEQNPILLSESEDDLIAKMVREQPESFPEISDMQQIDQVANWMDPPSFCDTEMYAYDWLS